MKKNTAKKPKINKGKENLSIILGNKNEKFVKRLICQLSMIFNSFFSIKLKIDCLLIPFDYLFQVYDYNTKSFQKEIKLYIRVNQEYFSEYKILNEIRPKVFPLHFRVIFPKFPYKGNIEFLTSNNKYISIKNNNIPKEFNSNFTFDLELILSDDIIKISDTKEFLQEKYFTFYINLNGEKKEVKVNLEKAPNCIKNNKYINANIFKLQKYGKTAYQEKWHEVKPNKLEECVDNKMIHVSIFGLESQIPEVIYIKDKIVNFKVKAKTNQFLILKISSMILGLGTYLEYINSSDSFYKFEKNDKVAIIGFIKGNKQFWYPTFITYDNYFTKLDQKIKKIKETADYGIIINEIRDKYETQFHNSENLGDYSVLAYMIATIGSKWSDFDKAMEMRKFLKQLSGFLFDIEINKKIDSILEKIKNDDTINKIYVEVIIKLFYIFKERFEIINKLNKEDINKKSDELMKKYFSFDKNKILDNNIIDDYFQYINNGIETSELENNNYEKQGKAIIIKEDNSSVFSENFERDLSLSKSSLSKNEVSTNIINFKTGIIDDISIPEEWSIFSLKEFYMKCIKLIRELPLYAINAKKENNEEKLRKTEECYIKLLQIYKNIPEQDNSFLGEYVMAFNDQFKKVTNNLINSNVKFDEGILPNKFELEEQTPEKLNEQYIIKPKLTINANLLEKQWIDDSDKQDDIKKNFEPSLLTPFISETSIHEFNKKNEDHMKQKKEKTKKIFEKKIPEKIIEKPEEIKIEEQPKDPEIKKEEKKKI